MIESLSTNDNLVLVDSVCYHNVDKVPVVNGPYSTVLHVDELSDLIFLMQDFHLYQLRVQLAKCVVLLEKINHFLHRKRNNMSSLSSNPGPYIHLKLLAGIIAVLDPSSRGLQLFYPRYDLF